MPRFANPYYERIAAGTPLPIRPAGPPRFHRSTQCGVPLILNIAAQVPSIACIKAEAVPSPQKIAVLRSGAEREIRPVPILTGLGGLYGFFDLERGSEGFQHLVLRFVPERRATTLTFISFPHSCASSRRLIGAHTTPI